MVHGNMTKEEIENSSLPFIYAIMSKMGRRLCEKLGVPYNPDKDDKQEEDNEDYPVPEASRTRGKKYSSKSSKDRKTYSAGSKQDIIDFFGGLATIEDNT